MEKLFYCEFTVAKRTEKIESSLVITIEYGITRTELVFRETLRETTLVFSAFGNVVAAMYNPAGVIV